MIVYNILYVASDDFQSCTDGVQDGPLDNWTIQIVVRHLTNLKQLAKCLQLANNETGKIKHGYQYIMLWASKSGKAGTILNLLHNIYFGLNEKSLVMRIVENLKHKGTYVSNIMHN